MRYSLILMILAACSDGNDHATVDQQAEVTFLETYATLESAQAQALSQSPVAPVVQTLDFSGPCATGGTIAMHGTYDGDGTDKATYTLATTMTSCTDSSGDRLDGSMQWSGTNADPTFTQTIDGTVAIVTTSYATTITFNNVTMTFTVTGTTATLVMTGSYTIGGKTYQVDGETWGSTLGG